MGCSEKTIFPFFISLPTTFSSVFAQLLTWGSLFGWSGPGVSKKKNRCFKHSERLKYSIMRNKPQELFTSGAIKVERPQALQAAGAGYAGACGSYSQIRVTITGLFGIRLS